MSINYWDLKPGFTFTAPGAGKVQYEIIKINNTTATAKRTRQNGETSELEISTHTILSIVNS